MNERLRLLRQELKLSRVAFGEKIGVSGDVINNLERGRVEMKELTFNMIVKTFYVSPEWLRYGTGEMFSERIARSSLDNLVEEFGLSDVDRILIERFLSLDKVQRDMVTDYVQQVAIALAKRSEEETTTEAAEAAYREALHIAPPTTSSTSHIISDTPEKSDKMA